MTLIRPEWSARSGSWELWEIAVIYAIWYWMERSGNRDSGLVGMSNMRRNHQSDEIRWWAYTDYQAQIKQ